MLGDDGGRNIRAGNVTVKPSLEATQNSHKANDDVDDVTSFSALDVT